MEHLFGNVEKPTEHEMIVMLTNELYQRHNKYKQLKAENEKLKQNNDVIQLIQGLKQELTPVIGFFNTRPEPPKKRLTKAQKLQLQIEDDLKRIEQQSMERIKKGNV